METHDLVYSICRHYVDDYRPELRPGDYEKIHGWIRSRNLDKLASCSSQLGGTLYSPEHCRVLRQVEAFFKKNDVFTNPSVTKEAAEIAFNEAENQCSLTNQRLDTFFSDADLFDPRFSDWVERAGRFISRTLGPVDAFYEELPRRIRVTSGATTTRSRAKALPHLKVSKRLTCTAKAEPYLQALSKFFGYGDLKPRYVLANRVELVPKSWKTDRTDRKSVV